MSFKSVQKWKSSGKTFKIGDYVVIRGHTTGKNTTGTITSIEVCNSGDGHVVLDGDRNTLSDFRFVNFDKSYYRNRKLEKLGI